MPSIPKKTRAQLKSTFVMDSIPTAEEFVALLEAGLDQPDDGIDVTGTTVSMTQAARATQGLAVTAGEVTVGTAGSVGTNDASMKVHADVTATGLITANAGLTANGKLTATSGLDVTAGTTTVGSATAGLSATIYNRLTIAASAAGTAATAGSLQVDSITPSNTGANANLTLAGKGTGTVDVKTPLRVDSMMPFNAATNVDLAIAGKGTGTVAVTGPLDAGSATAGSSATIYGPLTVASGAKTTTVGGVSTTVTTPSTLKVDSIGPSTLDTSSNGSLALAAKGAGNVTVTSPLVVGAGNAAVPTTLYSSLTIASSTTTPGSLFVDSIVPSRTDTSADLFLGAKGIGNVKMTTPLGVDSIKPNDAAATASVTLAAKGSGNVFITTPLKLGADLTPLSATIYGSLKLPSWTVTGPVAPNGPRTTGLLYVDKISASTTNGNLAVAGKGTGAVSTRKLAVNGALWVGTSAEKKSLSVSSAVAVDNISSMTANTNLTMNPVGIVDVRKSVTVSGGNVSVPNGDVVIGQSGGPTRTVTIYGSLAGSVTLTPQSSNWTVATLANGNSANTTVGYSPVSYRKDAIDLVRLRGSVNVSSSNSNYRSSDDTYLICVLPEGYRPSYTVWFHVVYGSGTSRGVRYVCVTRGGQVRAKGYGANFELDNISFRAGPPMLPTPWLKLNLDGNVTDTSGNNRAGTPTGISWEADSKFGTCAVFNGTNSMIDYPSAICGPQFTFALWVKRATDNPSSWSVLLEYGNDSPELVLNSQILSLYPGGVSGSTALDADRWYHVVVTQSEADCRMYVNGVLVKTATGKAQTGGSGLGIGKHSGDSYFKGRMARVMIYEQALGEDDITLLYNS